MNARAAIFPYFEQPALHIGGTTIYAFGCLVGLAVVSGHWLVVRRAARQGLDPSVTSRFVLWVILSGFIVSHLDYLAFLRPSPLLRPSSFFEQPLLWLNLWAGMSSFGGILGGVLGGWWYARRCGWSMADVLARLELVAFCFPFAWTVARFGCYLAHDHPGIPTASWLTVQYPGGARYDLGLLDCFLALSIGCTFLLLDRRPRARGFYFALFLLLYGPARLLLDNLRVEDRFGGVTAGQYGALAATLLGLFLLWRLLARPRTMPARGARHLSGRTASVIAARGEPC